jgi:demethoxyubiquinone hydroxylase (CLK1/Coq7/Cat5 family)
MLSDAAKKLVESFQKRKNNYENMAASSAIGFVTSDNLEHKNTALMYLAKAALVEELIQETCRAGV